MPVLTMEQIDQITPTVYPHGRRGDLLRAQDVLRMRRDGISFEEIALRCGYATAESARRAATTTAPRVIARANARSIARSFGVELEFTGYTSGLGTMAAAITAAGVTCEHEGYNHRVRRHWKIVPDGSVSRGGEVVSPILSPASGGYDQITTVMAAMRAQGATSDTTTGMHVHVDVRDLSRHAILQAVLLYAKYQEQIDYLLASSRRNNTGYCRRLDRSEIDSYERGIFPSHVDRYRTVNLASVSKYGSLEFRQHQGTLNAAKAKAWVEFCCAIVRTAERGLTDQFTEVTLEHLLEKLVELSALPQEQADYLMSRASRHGYAPARREPTPEPTVEAPAEQTVVVTIAAEPSNPEALMGWERELLDEPF